MSTVALPETETLEAIVDDMQVAMAQTVGTAWTATPVVDDPRVVHATVDVTGTDAHRVSVRYPLPGARRLAAAMFACDPADLGEAEVLDAVGELANVVAGGVKSLAEEGSRLGLPRAEVVAPDDAPASDGTPTTSVRRAWGGQVLEVVVAAAAGGA